MKARVWFCFAAALLISFSTGCGKSGKGRGAVAGDGGISQGTIRADSEYAVSGTLNGLNDGAHVVLVNNGVDELSVASNGTFTFAIPIPVGAEYNVTIKTQSPGQTCSVANGRGTLSGDATNLIITCSAMAYSVSGTVSGLNPGAELVLQNNGSDDLSVTADGLFAFPAKVASGATYTVTVKTQPAGQTCTVAQGGGTISRNVADVAIVCSTNTYTVGGLVSGLSGTVVLLYNDLVELALQANGPFTFASKTADGSGYSVVVKTQPMGQTCSVVHGAGIISGDVSDVTVTCLAITFTKTFGGPGDELANSVQQTADGGYITAGVTNSSVAGDMNVYLLKTDKDGNKQWEKTFGGTNDDVGNSVQQTVDGGYIIAGYSSSFGTNGIDVYLLKTDKDGTKLWEMTFGGTNSDVGNSVQQTLDGGYIIAGYSSSFGANGMDAYLVKTDKDGNKLWEKTFGDSHADAGYSVQETSDGGFITAGYTTLPDNNVNVYLVKTDKDGTKSWDKNFGGSYPDVGLSIRGTADGGYVIAGEKSYAGGIDSDVYLIKTDTNGNKSWENTLGGAYSDIGFSVQQTAEGGYIIAGGTSSSGAGGSDVNLTKTDKDGEKIWQKTFGGTKDDVGYAVQQTAGGGYIIAGVTASSGAGLGDVYLIKTDADGVVR